jgi:hypothetical protein
VREIEEVGPLAQLRCPFGHLQFQPAVGLTKCFLGLLPLSDVSVVGDDPANPWVV